MNIDDYIKLAVRTEAPTEHVTAKWQSIQAQPESTAPDPVRLLHALTGLTSERGELAYETKSPFALQEERGDVSWYCAIMLDAIGFDPSIPRPQPHAAVLFYDGFTAPSTTAGFTQELDRYLHLASDIVKAYAFYGRKTFVHPELTKDKEDDAMDVLDSITRLVLATFSTKEIREANIAKLKARYPEKFSEEAANARADKQEVSA